MGAAVIPEPVLTLARHGITPADPIGEDDNGQVFPAGTIAVRVRDNLDARGQWVGTYTAEDAQTLADRLATATYGSITRWWTQDEVTQLIVTTGGKLIQAAAGWRTAQDDLHDHVVSAYKAGMTKTRIHELSGVARTTIDRWIAE